MRLLEISFAVAALLLFAATGVGAKTCSRQDAIDAEQQAILKSWNAVYISFQRFAPQCDDGAISEGYSEAVSRLLAKDWKHVQVVYDLTRKDKAFEKFVLNHIDETISLYDLDALLANAQQHCPDRNTSLCRKIVERGKSLKERGSH